MRTRVHARLLGAMGHSLLMRLLPASHNVRGTLKVDIRFRRIICREGPLTVSTPSYRDVRFSVCGGRRSLPYCLLDFRPCRADFSRQSLVADIQYTCSEAETWFEGGSICSDLKGLKPGVLLEAGFDEVSPNSPKFKPISSKQTPAMQC